jgi:hypothetical protein
MKIQTRVAGVSQPDRQVVIAALHSEEELELRREPSNPHDQWAVAVFRRSPSGQIGYVPRFVGGDETKSLAEPIARLMDMGVRLYARLVEVKPAGLLSPVARGFRTPRSGSRRT